jgi:PIN domain nuclease of toxin-antitoxin system
LRQPAVLDASAVLALLAREPGHDNVADRLDDAAVSTVNWIEVMQRLHVIGITSLGRRAQMEGLGVTLHPLTAHQAELAAALREPTRTIGLSLADRACLALAIDLEAEALTADHAWADLPIDVAVRVIR